MRDVLNDGRWRSPEPITNQELAQHMNLSTGVAEVTGGGSNPAGGTSVPAR